jgi:hypothetical protein
MEDSKLRNRYKVIEVNPQPQHQMIHKNQHNHQKKSKQRSIPPPSMEVKEEDIPLHVPLEMSPVIRAIAAYSRRVGSYGSLRGAHALEKLIAAATPFASQEPALVDAIFEARNVAMSLRQEAINALTDINQD